MLGKDNSVEIIKDQLYWISDKNPPRNQPNAYFFCIDQDLVYEPFFADFGPLDLGKTYRFVTELEKLLKNPAYLKYKIYHYTSLDNAKRANAAFLMGAFQVIILKKSADEAWAPFKSVPAFTDFRDASMGPCTYKCTILDCLRGLDYAIKLKWFDIKNFNLRDYEFYERVENGDLNWIIPEKFIAFSGPSSTPRDPQGWRTFTPEDYVPIFKKFGVTLVTRLNKAQYDENRFVKNGIKHLDLYFLDGSCPSDEIIDKFLETVENEKGVVAVHCKAGLGRTGSLIACYAMKHYKFPAADFIGWIRICRPGSVLGPQQQFLVEKESKFHKLCANSPIYKTLQLPKDTKDRDSKEKIENVTQAMSNLQLNRGKSTEMSTRDQAIAKKGDFQQAERLLDAKRYHQSPSTSEHNSPTTTSQQVANSPAHTRKASNGMPSSSSPGVKKADDSPSSKYQDFKAGLSPLKTESKLFGQSGVASASKK